MNHEQEQQRSTQEILEDLGITASELYHRLNVRRELEERPYRTLAIAFGVGYLSAGGLFTRFTGKLVGLGLRALVLPAAQVAVAQLFEQMEQEEDGGY